jgi:hypothetical protein
MKLLLCLLLLLAYSLVVLGSDGIPKKKKRVVRRRTPVVSKAKTPTPIVVPKPAPQSPPLLTTTGELSNGTPVPRELTPLLEVTPGPTNPPVQVTTTVVEEHKGGNKLAWYLLGGAGVGTAVALLLDRDDGHSPSISPTPIIEHHPTPNPTTPVAEPATLLLLASGLLIGASRVSSLRL